MLGSDTVAGLRVRIGADVKDFQKTAAKIEKAVKPIRDRLRSVGEGLTRYVSLPLAGVGTAALLTAARMDSLRRGLIAVTGSAAEADKQLVRLKEVARLPGLGFEEAVQGSVRLQAVGYSAEEAERLLKGFGNALATIGGGRAELDRVVLALGQMATSPKVLQEEINQIREVLPQFTALMVDAFGTARSEDIQKLGVSGRDFVARMLIELEKLPTASAGIANDLENLQDTAREAFNAIGQAMIPVVSRILDKVVPAIERATEAFSSLDDETQEMVVSAGALTAALGPLAIAVNALLGPLGKVVALLKTPAGAFAGFIAVAAGATQLLRMQDRRTPGLAASLMDPTWASVQPRRAPEPFRMPVGLPRGVNVLTPFGNMALMDRLSRRAGETRVPPAIEAPFDAGAAIAAFEKRVEDFFNKVRNATRPFVERFGKRLREETIEGILFGRPGAAADTNPFTDDWAARLGLRSPEVDTLSLVGMPSPEEVNKLKAAIDAATPSITAAQVASAEWGAVMRSSLTDATAMMVDGLSWAIGDAIAGFESLGKSVKRIMQQVIASIMAAVARVIILKTLLSIFGGGGFFGGIISSVARAGGVTQGWGRASGLVSSSAVSGGSVRASQQAIAVRVVPTVLPSGDLLFASGEGTRRQVAGVLG